MKNGTSIGQKSSGRTSTEKVGNLKLNSPKSKGAKDSIYEEIKDTPFILIKRDGLYYIAWLSYVLSNPVKTRKEAMDKLKKERFELTAMYMLAILEEQKKEIMGTRIHKQIPEV